ncbi:MAG: SIMPL domain-containing protein, partial [Novosphingobium sp.]
MNALRTILAPLALLAAAPALAQTVASGPVVAAGNTLLTVSAEGRTERAPDLAVFNAGVTSQGKTAGEALSANSADMARVLAALKRAGIADRDVQTSQLSLNPIYAQQRPLPDGSYDPMGPKIVGYQASNQVTVRQRDLKSFGKVIDTLVEAGANQVNGPSFQMDDGDAAADAARIDAIK